MTHVQPTGPGNRPRFRVIVLAAMSIVAAAGIGALVAYLLTGSHSTAPPSSTGDCTASAMLVNPCRPWFGAAANGNPRA